jgi:hypothetical protein
MFFLPGTSPRLPVTATFMVPASLRSGVQGLLSLPSRRVHQQPLLLLALLLCFRRRVWQAHRVARKPFLKADLAGMRLVRAKPVPPRCPDIIASSR